MGILRKIFGGVSLVGVSGMVYVKLDVEKYKIYDGQSFKEAFKHYASLRSLAFIGSLTKRGLESATKDIRKAQEQFLMQQIKNNLDTEYSKDMMLDQVKSVEDFIAKHPLTSYQDYSRYISRMMSGEKKILTSKEPVVFAVTSGTSGKSNIIPMVQDQTTLFFTQGIAVLFKCMIEAFPETKYLNKDLKFFFSPNWRYSVSEIPIGPNSASPERSKNLLHIYTTPPAAYEVRSEPEALYLYLLFALLDPHTGMIEANFASIIYNAFSVMESRLPELLDDIENGRVNPDLDIDPTIRRELDTLLKPNPKRAQEIKEAAEGGQEGLVLRIWPEMHMMLATDTGTFELYGEKLRNGYCKGVPLYSPIYAASEGLIGVNIWPKQLPSRYLLHPKAQFFEFIPVSDMDVEQPKTLLLHQLKKDETYEVVITNASCLYRYRFGDVVKVVGFHNQCPIIEFKHRKGQFLNVRGEKTSESLFYDVLKGIVFHFWDGVKLSDYCCTESVILEDLSVPKSMKSSQPCYHVFLELESEKVGQEIRNISQKERKMLDDALMVHSFPYSSFRHKGSIGSVQVHLVKKGSFNELRSFMLDETSATSNQYKVPRVLRRPDAAKFMIDRMIGK